MDTCRTLFFMGSALLIASLTQAQPRIIDFGAISKYDVAKYHADYPRISTVKGYDEKQADKVWHDFWHEFTSYLKAKNFDFGKTRVVYVHLHFGASGNLDIFGYQFKKRKKDAKAEQFIQYLTEYLKTYDFNLQVSGPASQCGEIHVLAHSEIEEGK